jgi:hypothetical protein
MPSSSHVVADVDHADDQHGSHAYGADPEPATPSRSVGSSSPVTITRSPGYATSTTDVAASPTFTTHAPGSPDAPPLPPVPDPTPVGRPVKRL